MESNRCATTIRRDFLSSDISPSSENARRECEFVLERIVRPSFAGFSLTEKKTWRERKSKGDSRRSATGTRRRTDDESDSNRRSAAVQRVERRAKRNFHLKRKKMIHRSPNSRTSSCRRTCFRSGRWNESLRRRRAVDIVGR